MSGRLVARDESIRDEVDEVFDKCRWIIDSVKDEFEAFVKATVRMLESYKDGIESGAIRFPPNEEVIAEARRSNSRRNRRSQRHQTIPPKHFQNPPRFQRPNNRDRHNWLRR